MIVGRFRPQASSDLCLCIRSKSVYPGTKSHGRDFERRSRETAGAGNSSGRKIHISRRTGTSSTCGDFHYDTVTV